MRHRRPLFEIYLLKGMRMSGHGTHHQSNKDLGRYLAEFVARHNMCELPTLEKMRRAIQGMEGRRLRLKDLVGQDNQRQW